MNNSSRRTFLRTVAATVATSTFLTPSAGTARDVPRFLLAETGAGGNSGAGPAVTPSATEGPFHRKNSPFRAKVTPPGEPGQLLLIRGTVRSARGDALAMAVLDVWQANAQGRYDNDDPKNPPRADLFANRARLVTDEQGRYEFETIHPGPYKVGANLWRPNHIHFMVSHQGHKTLITQLFFRGDPHQEKDPFVKPGLVIDLESTRNGAVEFRTGRFDLVLAPV